MAFSFAIVTRRRQLWTAVALIAVCLLLSSLIRIETWNGPQLRLEGPRLDECGDLSALSMNAEAEANITRTRAELLARLQRLKELRAQHTRSPPRTEKPEERRTAPPPPRFTKVERLPSVQCPHVPAGGEGLLHELARRGVLARVPPNSQVKPTDSFAVGANIFVPAEEPILMPIEAAEIDYPTREPWCKTLTTSAVPEVTFCAVVRNAYRSKLLVEWIQWHRILGASFFHLFVEGNPTNSALLGAVKKFVDRGVVRIDRIPDGPPYSFLNSSAPTVDTAAAGLCVEHARRRAALSQSSTSTASTTWIALLDIDEFFHTHECLGSMIARTEDRVLRQSSSDAIRVGGLAVGWSRIGHRGADVDRDRTVFEATDFAAGTPDPWFRTIIRADVVIGSQPRPRDVSPLSLRVTPEERLCFTMQPPYQLVFQDGNLSLHDGKLAPATDHYDPTFALVAHYHTRTLAGTLQRAIERTRFPAPPRPLEDVVNVEFAMEQRSGFEETVPGQVAALHPVLLAALGHRAESRPLPHRTYRSMATPTKGDWQRALAPLLDRLLLGRPLDRDTLGAALNAAGMEATDLSVLGLREFAVAAVDEYWSLLHGNPPPTPTPV